MQKTRPVIQVATIDGDPPKDDGHDNDGYPIIDLPVKIYLQRQEGFWWNGHQFRKAGYPSIEITKKGAVKVLNAREVVIFTGKL